jgi:hypothetical protein
VRRARLYGPEFNAYLHKILLDFMGEEFPTPIRLDSLNWEMHFFKQPLQEIKRVGSSSPGIEANNHTSSAVIHCGILVKPRSDFAGIHLDPLTRNWTFIAIPDSRFFLFASF